MSAVPSQDADDMLIIWLEDVQGILLGLLTSCLLSDICLLFSMQLCKKNSKLGPDPPVNGLWTAEEGILIKMIFQTSYQNTDIKDVNALLSRCECSAADSGQ